MSTLALTVPQAIARVLAGDSNAYEALVRRHEGVLYRHARGMGLDHDTCLDLVQDALVRAYEKLSDCRDPSRFRAWLFRIARNLCFDHLRKARHPTLPLSSAPEAESVADTRLDALEQSMVHQALERLSPVLREAFLLKHDAGYTYEEIAEITGAGPSAVKMRVHRARVELCTYFEDAEPPSRRDAETSEAPSRRAAETSEAPSRRDAEPTTGDESSRPSVSPMKA
jgi:RNA polymerase sigma-70 factor (ECF subfamily)